MTASFLRATKDINSLDPRLIIADTFALHIFSIDLDLSTSRRMARHTSAVGLSRAAAAAVTASNRRVTAQSFDKFYTYPPSAFSQCGEKQVLPQRRIKTLMDCSTACTCSLVAKKGSSYRS